MVNTVQKKKKKIF